MGSGHLATGAAGEEAARSHYVTKGYRILSTNWRCRIGEIDIVAQRDGVLVFCEVKTRRGAAFGDGWEAVDAAKRRKLRALAEAYMLAEGPRRTSVRFDVASISMSGAEASVLVFEDAF